MWGLQIVGLTEGKVSKAKALDFVGTQKLQNKI